MKPIFELDFSTQVELEDGARSMPIPEDSRPSDQTLEQLYEIEELREDFDLLTTMIAARKFYGTAPPMKEMRAAFAEAEKGLSMFLHAMENGGPWVTRDLVETAISFASLPDYEKKDSDVAYWLEDFYKKASLFVECLGALKKHRSKANRGRSLHVGAKLTAAGLAWHFKKFCIPLSSYDSGPYMRALRIILAEVHNVHGEEAHRRHGLWALKRYGVISKGKGT